VWLSELRCQQYREMSDMAVEERAELQDPEDL
jgi:hypothetical protein